MLLPTTNPSVIRLLALLSITAGLGAAEGVANGLHLRAGNAASGFGLAAVSADFDGDKKLDFAVADQGSRYGYFQVEFRIGSLAPAFLDVSTNSSALDLAVRDVDNDEDQDIVMVWPLTREIMGVLVNDGNGGFRQESAAQFSIPKDPRESFETARRRNVCQFAAPGRPFSLAAPEFLELPGGTSNTSQHLTGSQTSRKSIQLACTRSGRAPPAI